MRNEILKKAVLSKKAIEYILKYGQPIANYEFIGYMFPATLRMNGICDLQGNWGFCACKYDEKGKEQKPLKEKEVIKHIKLLLKNGFLEFQEESPFPEFEYYSNIPIDYDKIMYIEDKLFDDDSSNDNIN